MFCGRFRTFAVGQSTILDAARVTVGRALADVTMLNADTIAI